MRPACNGKVRSRPLRRARADSESPASFFARAAAKTTVKMLSGLLYPTGGEATVLGHVPWRREGTFLRGMTLLMGNRSQLVWDIPAADSFLVLKEIYAVPDAQYKRTLDELTELLELQPLLHKPVRGLS